MILIIRNFIVKLFIGLLLEFTALPFSGEITMIYVGYLIYIGR